MNSLYHRVSIRKYQDKPVEKEKIIVNRPAGLTDTLTYSKDALWKSLNRNVADDQETRISVWA